MTGGGYLDVNREQQRDMSAQSNQPIEVGLGNRKVTPVGHWYRKGHFRSDEEARGAFRLAFQQYVDGLGTSLAEWMGISEAEAAAYKHNETLPRRRR